MEWVKSSSAMPDEQADAKGGRMLLWRLLHHPHELEFVAFPVQEIAVFFIIESGTQTRIYPLNPRTE